jgi:malate dehydrogenase (oxaloacetate-decarboxylating)
VVDRERRRAYRRSLAWPPALAEHGHEAVAPGLVVRGAGGAARILIGVSSAPGAFSETVVREVASHQTPCDLPHVEPTSQCEAIPKDVLAWTEAGLARHRQLC